MIIFLTVPTIISRTKQKKKSSPDWKRTIRAAPPSVFDFENKEYMMLWSVHKEPAHLKR